MHEHDGLMPHSHELRSDHLGVVSRETRDSISSMRYENVAAVLREIDLKHNAVVERLTALEKAAGGAPMIGDFIDDIRERLDRAEYRLHDAESAIAGLGAQTQHLSTIGPPEPVQGVTELPIVPLPPLPGRVAALAAKWAAYARELRAYAETRPGDQANNLYAAALMAEAKFTQECADELNRLL